VTTASSSALAGSFILRNREGKRIDVKRQLFFNLIVFLVYLALINLIFWNNPTSEITNPVSSAAIVLTICILTYAAVCLIVFISVYANKNR
jgi:phosphoglycerol transferase MdoB-like AlkP superfamily enzyme